MSRQLIQEYFNDIDRLKKVSGSTNEMVIRGAFRDLLRSWSRQKNLHFIDELTFATSRGTTVQPDGTIKHDLRLDLGYWEAKDTSDDLDTEIEKKLKRGYPQSNIIFENSRRAVLIQNREPVMDCSMTDGEQLLHLLQLFFSYEREEIRDFRRAVEQFKTDLPSVLEALREKIAEAYATNTKFRKAAERFLKHAKETINPTVREADVREMLIQHILTEEIFTQVFSNADFHRENNIAKQLYALEGEFFTGSIKRDTLKALEPYYATIRSNAALIGDHGEKQTFLKVIYENFYKIYNPKAADRLGVIYTPNEIVRFMIDGADWLCQKHFGRSLIDRNVEILDPATGTGTFICELLEHFRGQREKLAWKYKEELHANEVAILPYYVANLNIEATYAAITGQYAEFPSLCFVDTLDNVTPLGIKRGQHVGDLFGALSEENVERVKRQNRRKISVVIGNPPYNANQQNENDNNKNRAYPHIDDLIKRSYIAQSTAQKTKVYDMYARFFKWATDRLGDEGIIAFVTNNSFAKKDNYDGFRKLAASEFEEIFVVDLKGDARTSGEPRRQEGANIFDNQIKVGIAVSFFVKKRSSKKAAIHYVAARDYAKLEEKRDFIARQALKDIAFQPINPDLKNNWIGIATTAWDEFLPLASKETRASKWPSRERAIFKSYSLGISTNRDEWLYSFDLESGAKKARFLAETYDAIPSNTSDFSAPIKWSRNLKRRLAQGRREPFSNRLLRQANYRPFTRRWLYQSPLFVDEMGAAQSMFPVGALNRAIAYNDKGSRTGICIVATDGVGDLHFGAAIDAYQQVARYRFSSEGDRFDNITNWAENKFQAKYGKSITKDEIFDYVYAVLYDPVYREKYAINLKREFPRIPFYPDFKKWTAWGEKLLALHIGYEAVQPWPIQRADQADEKAKDAGLRPKVFLRADKENGSIRIDSETILSGLPPEAWTYRLGNRSGVEWILDQYKEKTPKDPTIREKFNTYKFADYKEKVIDLIARVARVSVETMEIVEQMKKAKRE